MSAMSCNPYAGGVCWEWHGPLSFNPYDPTPHWPPALTPAVFVALGLPDAAPEAMHLTRHEDELVSLALVPDAPIAFASQVSRASAPVPEPSGALLLSVALVAALWRARR